MNGTTEQIVIDGGEPDQPMEDCDIPTEDTPSPASPTSSEDTMSDSSKGEDEMISVGASQLPYMLHSDVDIVSAYSPSMKSSEMSRQEFRLPERVYSESKSGVQYSAFLETAELWKQFDDIGTEMIVTRRGRSVKHSSCKLLFMCRDGLCLEIIIKGHCGHSQNHPY